jgi:hypothetical protein
MFDLSAMPGTEPVEPGAEPGETGCGRWVGNCGGQHQGTVSITTTCACGRQVSKSCSNSNCPGVDWYC